MLDINLIRNEPEKVKKGLKAKNADPALVDKFLSFIFLKSQKPFLKEN